MAGKRKGKAWIIYLHLGKIIRSNRLQCPKINRGTGLCQENETNKKVLISLCCFYKYLSVQYSTFKSNQFPKLTPIQNTFNLYENNGCLCRQQSCSQKLENYFRNKENGMDLKQIVTLPSTGANLFQERKKQNEILPMKSIRQPF